MLGMSFGDILALGFFVALLVGGFAWMIAQMRKNRASTYDTCDECGYDMRETPERCPECGWMPPKRGPAPGRIDVDGLLEAAPVDAIRPRVPDPTEEQIAVYQTDYGDDADTLCEHLESRGISCAVRMEESVMQQGAYLNRQPYYQVVVWSGDRESAESLVQAATVVKQDEPQTAKTE